ncbi:UDP-N-acetylglucosamine transporter [Aplysia californica]|uniref:UDP-N-acetylglucosamine transporter n=1 Tax=Aplysia californica TaxID=6500 RepID=A0ABM0JJC5_APLCA|nr:UDP-N-acetylglucosamine transporter [Aplysia californica]XP_005094971.1 UDP-N-acetylglucosamine transporter [Aplysia californica]XP_035824744.1 UDP-N-acetylglucosamine transporter [Aplysia californica]
MSTPEEKFQPAAVTSSSSFPPVDLTMNKKGTYTDAGSPKPAQTTRASMKYVSLVLLTLQNAVLILVMRYVRIREGDMFVATTAVIMSELFKFCTCLLIIFIQEGSVQRWLQLLYQDIVCEPLDCLKVCVPSLVYVLQNNLLYIAVSNLDAATFQVTYQLKILTTAIFSVAMLKKQLSRFQWFSLVILFVGVAIVQMQPENTGSKTKVATEQSPIKGLVAVIISCFMSGFAGVYFEKILKGTRQSVWLRNIQLGALGAVIGLVTMYVKDGATVQEKGFFNGYDLVVWFVVCLQSFGGLLVAVVVKYADNILKGFATSAAIILSCVASMYFFEFQLSLQFTVGAAMVMLAVYVYSKYVPTQQNPPLLNAPGRKV